MVVRHHAVLLFSVGGAIQRMLLATVGKQKVPLGFTKLHISKWKTKADCHTEMSGQQTTSYRSSIRPLEKRTSTPHRITFDTM